jgi:O-antigen ligase
MPPNIAALVFAAGIIGLFVLDRESRSRGTSPALWIAVAWMFIGSSRMFSQWLQLESPDAAEAYVEGNPLDRAILTALLASGLAVLLARRRRIGPLLRANLPVLVFLGYCGVSCLWSDFPFVAFKRWTKALGNLTMVLLVLSDLRPRAAIKRFYASAGFLLVPLSVLLIKYYPDMGRGYYSWSWETFYVGVATDKNGLGVVCLVFGMAATWRLVDLLRERRGKDARGSLVAQGVLLVMTLWLLRMADSSTSLACLVLGGVLILLTAGDRSQTSTRLHAIAAALVCLGAVGYAFRDVYELAIRGLGRSPTLTGRTEIWVDLFSMPLNPWVGTGFETFWVGPRLDALWAKYAFKPNQAHNGYIETYLNLGWIGLALLAFLLASGYRNVVRTFQNDPSLGALGFAFLAVSIIYNVTEAAFKVMNPIWISFLLSTAAVPAVMLVHDTGVPSPTTQRTRTRGPSGALRRWRVRTPQGATATPAVRTGSSPSR